MVGFGKKVDILFYFYFYFYFYLKQFLLYFLKIDYFFCHLFIASTKITEKSARTM